MKKEDITDEWVLANFDINKERKTNNVVESLGSCHYDTCGKTEFDQYLDDLKASVEDKCKLFNEVTAKLNSKILIQHEIDHGWHGDAATTELVVYVSHDVVETDVQVISRIKKRERGKITKVEAADKRKATNEEKEREQLKRLQAKYGES